MKLERIDYFPAKLAKGDQFCNRKAEQLAINRNIKLARHTVLVSPRRYGKSSLIHKIAAEKNMPFVSVDLFLAHDDKTIVKRLLTGISGVIAELIPFSQKALAMVQKYFASFNVAFSTKGFNLELSQTAGVHDPVDQLFDALRSLAMLAKEKMKKVIFFIDEFQEITNAASTTSLQGALRHVAQDTSWIIFVFSGSNRHLLQELFDDKNKPLYMLCDKLFLNRMMATDYQPFIQNAAKQRWHKTLDMHVLNRILLLTELHPFYVNLLCNELWKHKNAPEIDDVALAWAACFDMEERRIIAELEKLTKNQQDILKFLSVEPTNEPTSQAVLSAVGLSISSMRLGIKTLLEKDMIHLIKKEDPELPGIKIGQYRVLDPLISFALRKFN